MKVAVLGATGETGSSIVDALVESTDPVFVSQPLAFQCPPILSPPPTPRLTNRPARHLTPRGQEVTALLRPSTAAGEAATALTKRGVRVVAADLEGTADDLFPAVQGQDVVISAIRPLDLRKQIPLIDAAKKAGVKRFVPCDFATVAPPKGFMHIREIVGVFLEAHLEPGSSTRTQLPRPRCLD